MDKNEQRRRLCMLRDRLKREYNEARQKCEECAEELELVEALLKQFSSTPVVEHKNQELFARSDVYGQNDGSMRNAESYRKRTRDYASISDTYFGRSSEPVAENTVQNKKVQDIKDIELDFLTKGSNVVDKPVRDEVSEDVINVGNANNTIELEQMSDKTVLQPVVEGGVPENVIPVGNANNTIELEQIPVRPMPQLIVEGSDPYAVIKEDDRKDYENFMKNYMEGTLPDDKRKVLGIGQNLSNLTREKWEDYEGKDEIYLVAGDGGKYWAYPMPARERSFFLVPSKQVKFQYLQCISNGFPAFFDFDMDKATGDTGLTPVVVLPAIIEMDTEGRYFRAGQGDEYPPKGKLKL